MTKKSITDEALMETIKVALEKRLGLQADEAAREVFSEIKSRVGEGAIMRRVQANLAAAFKEGFKTGQSAGRFARWHPEYWRSSHMAKAQKDPAQEQAAQYFSRYNF